MARLLPSIPLSLTAQSSLLLNCSRTSTIIQQRPTTHTTTLNLNLNQTRSATFIPRPRRPYTFTQLVTLSDNSTYIIRTTSPQPIYRAAKDTRNTLTWQPSEKRFQNVELDEAGKLAAFRERYGRAFDSTMESGGEEAGVDGTSAGQGSGVDAYADLISSYATADTGAMKDAPQPVSAKKKK